MRRGLLNALVVIALLMIVGGHITDPFGLDREYQTGQEIDYSVVALAAAGAVMFLTFTAAAARLLSRPSRSFPERPIVGTLRMAPSVFLPDDLSASSPPALRI